MLCYYVRVEFSSLRFALNSRNTASSRQEETRLQLVFGLIFLPPTANFTRLGAVQRVHEITPYFGTVDSFTHRWRRRFEEFRIAGAMVTPANTYTGASSTFHESTSNFVWKKSSNRLSI